jgi:hypothetical protein
VVKVAGKDKAGKGGGDKASCAGKPGSGSKAPKPDLHFSQQHTSLVELARWPGATHHDSAPARTVFHGFGQGG